jgi:predicted phosphoribosyltransferase
MPRRYRLTAVRIRAVGQAYGNFDQVTDEEAMAYLDRES